MNVKRNLCLAQKYDIFLIEETGENGELVDILAMDGTRVSASMDWEYILPLEGGESEDTDAYWRDVDLAIWSLIQHNRKSEAWKACTQAYGGILNKREMAEHFRQQRIL